MSDHGGHGGHEKASGKSSEYTASDFLGMGLFWRLLKNTVNRKGVQEFLQTASQYSIGAAMGVFVGIGGLFGAEGGGEGHGGGHGHH